MFPFLSCRQGTLALNPKCRIWCQAVILLGLSSLAGCGGSSPSSISQQPVTVSITGAPPSTIGVGANWQYTATVSGSTNQNVSWTASAGTIDATTGLYIAPNSVPNPATVTIIAAAQANPSSTKSTTVTVQATDPLGSVSSSSPLGSCAGSVSGGTCYQLAISCPGVADFSAYLKVNNPGGAPAGTVLLGTGTGGSGLYDDPTAGGYVDGSNVITSLLSSGYNTVQVSFGAPFDNGTTPRGWLTGPGGVRRLACRYATVADWVYNHPTIINPNAATTTSAPMCATGNSGGSAALVYAAYNYGLNSELAMIEPTSGPVMSRIDQGCSPCSSNFQGNICPASNNNPNLCYESADASIIDEAYQSPGASTPTPCSDALNGNPGSNAQALFLSDSILYAGASQQPVNIPNTRFKMLLGDDDTSNAVPQATVFEALVQPSPSSPSPLYQCLPGVQHDIPSYATGATQIANDIIAYCH